MSEHGKSTSCATGEAFRDLTMNLQSLVHSLTDYVYEMNEYDEDVYNSRGENFRDVAQGQDRHYIPLLEDDFDSHYTSNQYQGQYFDDTRRDDEEQDEPTLAQLMFQLMTIQAQQSEMMAMQAQQSKDMAAMQAQHSKDFQILTSKLQQEEAALKILEAQLAQQVASSSCNPEKSHLQPDVRPADANIITPKNGEVFEDKERALTEVVEEDEQLEQGEAKEDEEQETPYVALSAYVPPIHSSQRQIEVPVEMINDHVVIDVCQLTIFERKVLSDIHAKNSDTTEVMKKSFHEAPEILICNTRLKTEPMEINSGRDPSIGLLEVDS